MKIIKVAIALCIIISIFTGCNSTKDVVSVSPDSYSDSENTQSSAIDKKDGYISENTSTDINTKTKGKNAFLEGLSNLFASKFIEYDKTTLFTPGAFGGIKQQTASTVIYPKTGEAGFGSPIMAAYYYLTFDADGRKKIEKAVNQYLSDFENKKLQRKSKKSFKAYGSVKSRLYWGTIKNSTPSNAEDNIYLGYKFEGNSPYFTLFMYPTLNRIYTGPDCNYPEKSISLTYYFTKAQAQTLVNALSDDNIATAFLDYETNTFGTETNDDYSDYDDTSEDEITNDITEDSANNDALETEADNPEGENNIADAAEE